MCTFANGLMDYHMHQVLVNLYLFIFVEDYQVTPFFISFVKCSIKNHYQPQSPFSFKAFKLTIVDKQPNQCC